MFLRYSHPRSPNVYTHNPAESTKRAHNSPQFPTDSPIPARLPPARNHRAHRSSSRAKPGATRDGDGGGSHAPPAPIPTARIGRPDLPHVTSTCFRCFICMLQVFHTDVVKLDQDVVYVAMVVHVCCKCLFPIFLLIFHLGCKCVYLYIACFLTHTSQVFYLDITYVCTVFQVFFICCCKCFRRMFQIFQLFCTYVASVSSECFKRRKRCHACCNVSHLS
jgi:hypothetical protein